MALYWGVARSALLLRPRRQGEDAFDVDDLYDDYNNLSASSAQRLLRFWQARQAAPAAFQAAPAIQSDSTEKYLLPV
jgi:hypothetical protein